MAPKIVDKAQKRKEITQIAIQVFAARGVAQTKMTDIAQAAGLGKGTLYEYFPSKDDLLTAAFQEFFQQLDELAFVDFEQTESASQKISQIFIAFRTLTQTEFAPYFPLLLEAWAVGSHDKTSAVGSYMLGKYDMYKELIAGWIQEGIDQGEFKSISAEAVAQALISMGDGLLLYWILLKDDYPIETVTQTALEMMLNGLKK